MSHSVIKGVKSSKFKSTDQILTTYLTFYALFNGDGFEICNQHLHDLHGLFFPTNIFVFFLNLFLSIFIFHQKNFKFVGRKIYDVRKEREKRESRHEIFFEK